MRTAYAVVAIAIAITIVLTAATVGQLHQATHRNPICDSPAWPEPDCKPSTVAKYIGR